MAGATEGWGEAAGDGLAAGGDTLAAGNGTAEAAALGSDAALAAAADGAAALTEAAGGAAAELSSGVVLSATMAAVDGMHAATGLPWWATIASVGVLVRAAMLPISLQGMRASASLMPLLRQAREELAAEARPPLPPASPPPTAEERREAYKQQRWQRAQQKGQTSSQQQEQQEQQHAEERQQQQERLQAPPPPSTAAILDCFGQLRRAAGAPHPIWALASPLAQLPVFVTAMATVRTMSLNSWPGFREGGAAWFTDLTLPAMDLTQWVAPLGGWRWAGWLGQGRAGRTVLPEHAASSCARCCAPAAAPQAGRRLSPPLHPVLQALPAWCCPPPSPSRCLPTSTPHSRVRCRLFAGDDGTVVLLRLLHVPLLCSSLLTLHGPRFCSYDARPPGSAGRHGPHNTKEHDHLSPCPT